MTDTVSNRRTIGSRLTLGRIGVAVASLAVATSLATSGWLFSPANPQTSAPAMTLDFGDFHELFASGNVPTNWIQESYFGWLGWTLAIVTIAPAGLAVLRSGRPTQIAAAGASLTSLLAMTFALKGVGSWENLMDQVPNVRVGGYLMAIGLLTIFVVNVVAARSMTADRRTR